MGLRRSARPLAALVVAAVLISCSSSTDTGEATSGTAATTLASPATTATTTAVTAAAAENEAGSTTTAPPATTSATTVVTSVSLVPPRLDDASLYPPLPPQPEGVPFPTEEWPVGELPAGVPASALDDAVATAFGAPDASARVRSLVVVQGGEIVYERYHPLDDADTATDSWSVAKSFTSAALGLAVGDGLLDPLAPAPIPEWSATDDPRADITLADLLHMSSGLEWTESYGPGDDPIEMIGAPDAAAYVIDKPLVTAPGELWNYSTGTTAVLSRILADAVGGNDAEIDFITDRLLRPIGITSTRLALDPSGRFYGGFGADSTPRDFARFGLLFLRDGVWDGERILPEGWVDYSRTPASSNPSYGAQWWINGTGPTALFSAQGLFGQQIIMSPALDLVVVTTSTQGGDPQTLSNTVIQLFADAAG